MNLCESTLAFGKAEEPPPALTRFPLARLVNDVIDSERLAAGDYDLSFSEDVPGGMVIRADAEQLYRVIGNLVRNARQAIVATRQARARSRSAPARPRANGTSSSPIPGRACRRRRRSICSSRSRAACARTASASAWRSPQS